MPGGGLATVANPVLALPADRSRKARLWFIGGWPPSTVALVLVTVNIVLYLVSSYFSAHVQSVLTVPERIRLFQVDGRTLQLFGSANGELVAQGELWRLITSSFLHLDYRHIAPNIFGLFFIGGPVERHFGRRKTFVIFILAGALGTMAVMWAFPAKTIVGASAGAFGLVGAMLVRDLQTIQQPAWKVCAPYLGLFILELCAGLSLPSITTHTVGFCAGTMLSSVAVIRSVRVNAEIAWNMATWAAVAGTALCFAQAPVLRF